MLNAPSSKPLPRQIDPRKFAQQGVVISGLVELASLSRLCDTVSADKGSISAELVFGLNDRRLPQLTGQIQAELYVTCQRCLDLTPIEVPCQVDLAMVWDEESAAKLPKTQDSWIVAEGQTDIYQVVEDELLLSLPIVSYHETECVPSTHFSSIDKAVSQQISDTEAQKTNPFQVLGQLKGQLSNSQSGKKAPKD